MSLRVSIPAARLLPRGPLDFARQVLLFAAALNVYRLTRDLADDPEAATAGLGAVAARWLGRVRPGAWSFLPRSGAAAA